MSNELARELEINSTSVRRDISYLGHMGRQGYGYNISSLIDELKKELGDGKDEGIVLMGVGNMGKALLKYNTFSFQVGRIVCCFDVDEQNIGIKENVPVYHYRELYNKFPKGVKIAILALPGNVAQKVADELNQKSENPYNKTPEQQVHTAEQTIYYLPGDEIDLVLPEAQFMGYKRWYDYETGSNPVWNLNESDRTTWHVAPAGTNINNSYGDSHGIYSTTNTNTNNPTLYGWTDGAAHIMACDVSNYKDYEILYNDKGDIDTIVEPTLSYRQLWHIRPASEMADKFAELAEGEYLEVHNYMAPTNKNIFLVPDYGHNREVLCHNNYFYYLTNSNSLLMSFHFLIRFFQQLFHFISIKNTSK